MTLFLSLISGAIGGNVAAGVVRPYNLGLWANILVGALFGALIGELLRAQLVGWAELSSLMMTILVSIFAGGLGVILVGFLRGLIRK